MIYGTKQNKKAEKTGYLVFDTGKRVFLNKKEVIEYENKVKEYQLAYKMKNI